MFERIATMLKSTDYARMLDNKTFTEWSLKQINTRTALREFKGNNRIPIGYEIEEELFVKWLNSLGYRRYGE